MKYEAEFRAMPSGIDEILWVQGILQDLRIRYEEPIRVLCDNRSAISIAHNPVYHDQIRPCLLILITITLKKN